MAKLKKNSVDWLANQRDVHNLIMNLGARNLTQIKAVYITSDTEEQIASYDKMVMHDSIEADRKAMDWVSAMIEESNRTDDRYLYFRLLRWN